VRIGNGNGIGYVGVGAAGLLSVERVGASAPGHVIMQKCGPTAMNISKRALALL